MNYKQVIHFLNSIETKSYNLDLKSIKTLLKKLNNPENKYKTIHVAGTNGKGSTCAMLSSIIKEAGYKVGLYTSPHINKINERIKINNIDITDKNFAKTFTTIHKNLTDQTYFEILTATAFQHFKEQEVDIAIIETGLGGRLDATNVITPLLSVITKIGLDHQQYLGNTIEEIAKEKAGIIKPNIPFITKELEIIKLNKINLITPKHYNFPLSLKGDYQKENANLAIEASLFLKIEETTIKKGLLNTKWPARMEFKKENIIIDAAHNTDGQLALKKEINKLNKKTITICGFLKDKNIEQMIKIIESYSDEIILIKPNSYRAEEPEQIAKLISKPHKISRPENIQFNNSDLFIITGSFYLIERFKNIDFSKKP